MVKWRNKIAFLTAFIFIFMNFFIEAPVFADMQNATSIALDRDYTGSVKNGAQYYTFKLSKDGKVKVSMNKHKTSSWYVDVMNAQGDRLKGFETEYGTNVSGNEEREIGLPAGTYYIKITSNQNGYDNAYKFRVNFTASDVYEKEFNNTQQTANKIQLNTVYKGALQESWDDDYYTFTLPSDGNVTFSMKRNKTASWYVYITDSNGKSYKYFTTEYGVNATGNEERQIGLPKGTYYVKIEDNQKVEDVPYEFQMKFQASNNFEKEFNNTLQTANKIQLNTVYKGAFQESWDDDYYTFTLPSDGNVTFSMKRNKTASWYVYITDSNGNSYTYFPTEYGVNATGDEERQIGLPKGTYYVRIDDNQNTEDVPYEFQVKFQASNYFEKEFNDSFAQANSIQLNQNYRGTPQNGSDYDYYSFSIDTTKVIRMNMERSKESSWYIALYDAKQNYVDSFSTEYGTNAAGNEERTYTLAKGRYYIKVYNWRDAVDKPYRFSVLDRSLQLTEKQIQVNNYKGKDDVVTVSGVKVNDVVNVYDQPTGGKLLGSVKVTKGTQVSMNVKQLGPKAGKVYVSLTQPGMGEGMRTASSFAGEPTNALQAGQVKVVNNKGKADVITVSNVKQGSVVKVYDQATGGKLLGTATVTSGTQAVINVNQIGEKASSVYVTLTESGLLESARTAYQFAGEPTNALQAGQVNVVNNKGKADVITVSNVKQGSVVKVYDQATGGKLLGTATVTSGTQAVINVNQIGEKASSVYVTLTEPGLLESSRTACKFASEPTNALQAGQVKVDNNKGKADVITVSGLQVNDVVKVYDQATGGKLLGTATVTKGTQAVVSVQQLGEKAGATYVTVTKPGMNESIRTAYKFEGEVSNSLQVNQVKITNNKGKADYVAVSGIAKGDIVRVYDANSKLLVTSPQATGTTVTVDVKQLGTQAGYAYVSVTRAGMKESMKVKVAYKAE